MALESLHWNILPNALGVRIDAVDLRLLRLVGVLYRFSGLRADVVLMTLDANAWHKLGNQVRC